MTEKEVVKEADEPTTEKLTEWLNDNANLGDFEEGDGISYNKESEIFTIDLYITLEDARKLYKERDGDINDQS